MESSIWLTWDIEQYYTNPVQQWFQESALACSGGLVMSRLFMHQQDEPPQQRLKEIWKLNNLYALSIWSTNLHLSLQNSQQEAAKVDYFTWVRNWVTKFNSMSYMFELFMCQCHSTVIAAASVTLTFRFLFVYVFDQCKLICYYLLVQKKGNKNKNNP